MAISKAEQQIVDQLRVDGYSDQDIIGRIGAGRMGRSSSVSDTQVERQKAKTNAESSQNFFQETGGDIVQTLQGMGGELVDLYATGAEIVTDDDYNVAQKVYGTLAKTVSTPFAVAGQGVIGIGKGLLSQDAENSISKIFSDSVEGLAKTDQGQKIAEWYTGLNKDDKLFVDSVINVADIVEVAAPLKLLTRALDVATPDFKPTAPTATPDVPSPVSPDGAPSLAEGAGQVISELGERVPRAIEKGKESLEAAAERKQLIENSPKPVQNAYKAGVDERVIRVVDTSDPAKRADMQEMTLLAENKLKGTEFAENPMSVAGTRVSDQYKALDTKRKDVGSQIGEAVDALSTKGAVNIQKAYLDANDVLRSAFVKIDVDGKLNFDTSNLTPAQGKKVQEMYDIIVRNGTELTPREVWNLDNKFSQLQREARFSEIGDILIDTPRGKDSIFNVMRDIYGATLEEIAPNIKPLNREYGNLRRLQNDVEKSLVKSGNFETVNADPATFAEVNIGRIFSNAQTAGAFRDIANRLDVTSREYGYSGSIPSELAWFGKQLENIYPETVREGSFKGGITSSFASAVGKVLDFGAPDITDQQKALRELLGITDDVAPTTKAGDFFEPPKKSTFQKVKDVISDERGSVKLSGESESQRLKGLNESSANTNTLSESGAEVVNKYLKHIDGTKKLTGDELINVKADVQVIAERAGLTSATKGDNALANELADKYTSQIAD